MDNGSPLVYKYKIIGILSLFSANSLGHSTAYTKIKTYVEYIEEAMKRGPSNKRIQNNPNNVSNCKPKKKPTRVQPLPYPAQKYYYT